MTIDDLSSQNFATAAEAAQFFGDVDPRTIREAIKAGEIPGTQVGTRWMVPTSWLRQQAGSPGKSEAPLIDVDQLADAVANRIVARLASILISSQLPVDANGAAGTAPQAGQEQAGSHEHDTSAA